MLYPLSYEGLKRVHYPERCASRQDGIAGRRNGAWMADASLLMCPSCQAGNRPGAKYCAACGAAIAVRCPGCGRELRPEARFCDECGRAVYDVASSGEVSAPPSRGGGQLLDPRDELEGERKQVTVLFADVKGSMDLAGRLDPEEWARIMGRFVDILADGVHRFEGIVDKFTGDGIMALFGAPIAFEDHARRACHAALHLIAKPSEAMPTSFSGPTG